MRLLSRFFQSRQVEFQTTAWDGVPWKWDSAPARVVALGDVHGDLRSLCALLVDRGLIDEGGAWTGGRATLVLLGDLIGGHRESRLVLNLVLRLEKEAAAAGGRVHALLGNHDVLVFGAKTPKATAAEKALYKQYSIQGLERPSWKHAFSARTPYGAFLASRNAVVQIGSTVYCHAGLQRWVLEVDPSRVNATVRAWIRYWQGRGPRPASATRWTVGAAKMGRHSDWALGPLWTRGFKTDGRRRPRGGPEREQFKSILEKLGARRMVVGHAPTPYQEAILEHPFYGDKVVMIDTGMYKPETGRPCALEVQGDKLTVHPIQRPRQSGACEAREWRLLESPAPQSLWRRLRGWFR